MSEDSKVITISFARLVAESDEDWAAARKDMAKALQAAFNARRSSEEANARAERKL